MSAAGARAGARLLPFVFLALATFIPAASAGDLAFLLSQPARTGAQARGDAALVVGIEAYAYMDDVPYALSDARAFEEYLVYTRGVPGDRVESLTTAPNKEKVQQAWARAAALVEPGGTLWLYFAGHGAVDQSGRRVLLGADTQRDLDSFGARSLAVEDLEAAVAASPAERVVLVLDACYVGRSRTDANLLPGQDRLALSSKEFHPGRRTIVWSAASEGQTAKAYPPGRHGAFSLFAIGALRGWADGELDQTRDNKVTLDEAQAYVRRALRVVGLTEQKPELLGDGGWIVSRSGRALEAPPKLEGPPPDGRDSSGEATDGYEDPRIGSGTVNVEEASLGNLMRQAEQAAREQQTADEAARVTAMEAAAKERAAEEAAKRAADELRRMQDERLASLESDTRAGATVTVQPPC